MPVAQWHSRTTDPERKRNGQAVAESHFCALAAAVRTPRHADTELALSMRYAFGVCFIGGSRKECTSSCMVDAKGEVSEHGANNSDKHRELGPEAFA